MENTESSNPQTSQIPLTLEDIREAVRAELQQLTCLKCGHALDSRQSSQRTASEIASDAAAQLKRYINRET